MERLTEKIRNKHTGEVLAYRVKCHKDVEAVQKLGRLEDLEEQRKLLKLPCAVGDTVYVLRIDNEVYMMNNEKVWKIAEERFEIRHFDCIGKTVFLSREEAKAALKELDNKEARK